MIGGLRPLYVSIPTLVLLVLLFIVGVLLAVFVRLPWLLLTAQWTKAGRIVQAMDRLCAAGMPFGWDGRSTISWECGGNGGTFCRAVCAALDRLFQKRHCERERQT